MTIFARPDDPTRFKANPGMLSSKLGEGEDESDDDEDDEEGEGVKKAGQKYVAPKNVPKHFEEDKSKEELQVMESIFFLLHFIPLRLNKQLRRRNPPSLML